MKEEDKKRDRQMTPCGCWCGGIPQPGVGHTPCKTGAGFNPTKFWANQGQAILPTHRETVRQRKNGEQSRDDGEKLI